MKKISGVYKITNTITGDFYIGSSKNVKRRWQQHKRQSYWKALPNNKLYQAFKKYGVDKFTLQIIELVEPEYLKQVEQEFIDMLKPSYNKNNAKGCDRKEVKRKYFQSEKGKEARRKADKKYQNQLCLYNGKTLKLDSLSKMFRKAGIEHPCIEAKKYLIK